MARLTNLYKNFTSIPRLVLLILVICTLSMCKSRTESTDKVIEVDIDSSQMLLKYKNSIFCIPSPFQINLFLSKIKIAEDESLVNSPINISNYSSSVKKAINIGVYGADLGYLRLFPNTQNLNQYLLAIKQLASELNINEAYNKELLTKIEKNLNNNDSLFIYFSALYQHADAFLKENSRQQTSALIIAGGWVESFFLLTQLYKKTGKNELYSFISQQKYALENIIKLLAPFYNTSEELTNITDQLVDLAYQFDVIDLKFGTKNPSITNNNGIYEINSTTEIENSMKEIEGIIEKTSTARNSIVQ